MPFSIYLGYDPPLSKEHVRISGTTFYGGRDKASGDVGETRSYPAFVGRLARRRTFRLPS